MENTPLSEITKFTKEQGKRKGGTLLDQFLSSRALLRGFLEMFRDQKDDVGEKIEKASDNTELKRRTNDWMRLSNQVDELEKHLHEPPEKRT